MLALATAMALQHWKDQVPIETIVKTAEPTVAGSRGAQRQNPQRRMGARPQRRTAAAVGAAAHRVSAQSRRCRVFYLYQRHRRSSNRGRSSQEQGGVDAAAARQQRRAAGEARLQADEDQVRPEDAAGIHHLGMASTWWRRTERSAARIEHRSRRLRRTAAGRAGVDRRRDERHHPAPYE